MAERVAVITDIHANLPALEAALARIDELGIGRVYCGGDLVGYGAPSRPSTATTPSPAISTTAAVATSPHTTARSAGSRSSGRSPTSCASCRSTCASRSTARRSTSCKDGDPRAAFAVVSGDEVTIERVAYDAPAVAAEVRDAGLPVEFADKLPIAA